MLNATGYKINKFNIGSYVCAESIAFIQYYESVLSPAIIIEAFVVDSNGILSGDPSRNIPGLKGGEECEVEITDANGKLVFTGDRKLFLREISSAKSTATSSTFAIKLTTKESLINETSRCCKRYKGKIHDIVTTISNETFLRDGAGEQLFVEDTENQYEFIGNARKPFHVITWLAKKSIPDGGRAKKETKGSAGYFFYEDRDGHKFRSVDSIIKTSTSRVIDPIVYTQSETSSTISDNRDKILNVTFDTNYDLLENLRLGMFSNVNYFYNAFTQTSSCFQYNLVDSYSNKLNTLNKGASVYPIPEYLKTSPSRIMFSIVDSGTLQSNGEYPDKSFPQDQNRYQAQSVVRYNLIFSQTVSITVPSNVLLRVGDVIKCKFLQPKKGEDDLRSGKYIIAELSHKFSEGSGYSGLKLIRDSYGD